MSGTTADRPAEPHPHVWGRWFPKTNTHQWRECTVLGCHESETRKAPR